MQQPKISQQDKKDLEKFVKFLCLKSTQIIVQGRLGRSISSSCSPLPTGAEWFNLAVKDYPEIQKEAKCALLEGNPSADSSFVIEISLRTSDSESLTLEVWSLSVVKKFEEARIHHTVYNRMSLLLKSLMCISRATPAYKLSRTQGSEYVVCFRVYRGKIDVGDLGEGFKTLRVGTIGTPTGTIILSAAFRTAENLHVSTKKLAPGTGGPVQVSPDHFYFPKNASSPARPCCTLQSRLISRGSLESSSQSPRIPVESPSYGTLPTSFSTSPADLTQQEMMRLRQSADQAAVFTVGTPPNLRSQSKLEGTPPYLVSSHRRFSDLTRVNPPLPKDESVLHPRQQDKRFTHSQSEQNISGAGRFESPGYSSKQNSSQYKSPTAPQPHHYYSRGDVDRHKTIQTSNRSTRTLTNDMSLFKPITEDGSNDQTRRSLSGRSSDAPDGQYKNASSLPMDILFSPKHRKNNSESVTTLKSNSPSNARVGFPDNNETTTHLVHVPPSHSFAQSQRLSPPANAPLDRLILPSPGAFVSNSKTAARAYNTLSGISDTQRLPFRGLLTDPTLNQDTTKRKNKRNPGSNSSSSDTSPESVKERGGRLSSHSSLSSHHSSDRSPSPSSRFPPFSGLEDEFVMVDLNPAFGKSDSASDLGSFYRECENAPDLVMFQENNGTEDQEALLDLTKQLEDFERDAEDFDNFVEELQSA